MRTINQKGLSALDMLLGIALTAVICAAGYFAYKNTLGHQNAAGSPTPSAMASPSPAPTASTPFDITDLGVKFALPASFSDLEYKVVHLAGDQAVNSVALSSKRLDAAGCGLDSAPLGYLTYDADKGGSMVAKARGSNLYYLQPQGACKAEASLQDWQTLKVALQSLVTDYKQ